MIADIMNPGTGTSDRPRGLFVACSRRAGALPGRPTFQSVAGPLILIKKRLSQFDAVRLVDVEHGDGGAAGLRVADQHGANPLEVALPALPARVEQQHDVAAQWISATQIWALFEVAAVTAPAAVLEAVAAAVLLGDDVLDMERRRRSGRVRKVAILAPMAGPVANELTQ